MFFILDLVALIIFLGTVVSCWNKGFFKSFFGTIKVVVAIVVSYMFMPTLSYVYRTKFIQKAISGAVADRIHSLVQTTSDSFNLSKLFTDMPAEFSDIMTRYGADAEKLTESYGKMTNAAETSVNELAQTITYPVVKMVSDILAYITLFVGTMIILAIVVKLVGIVMKLPVLSHIDKLLGIVFGAFSGLLLLWVYCNVVSFGVDALNVVKPGVVGNNVIENTYIIRHLVKLFGSGIFGK